MSSVIIFANFASLKSKTTIVGIRFNSSSKLLHPTSTNCNSFCLVRSVIWIVFINFERIS